MTDTYILAYPPSVNRYWRHVGTRTLLSAEGRVYRRTVQAQVAGHNSGQPQSPLTGRLAVEITAHPPDRRRRDLDNVPKALLDALQHAGVYADDSQIDRLLVVRGTVEPPCGVVVVALRVVGGDGA